MSKATGNKSENDERGKSQGADRVPAEQQNFHQNGDHDQQQEQELDVTSPLPSSRNGDPLRTSRTTRDSSRREREDKKLNLEKLQKKVSRKMALGRLRQAVLQQDEEKIRNELIEIKEHHPDLGTTRHVDDAEKMLKILEAAKRLTSSCNEKSVDGIRAAIQMIENSDSEGLHEALKFQVREARYVLEDLERPPVRRAYRWQMDRYALNELRHYTSPPPGVLQVMQAVLLLLGEDEDSTKTWPDVQRLSKPNGPQSLYNRIIHLQVRNVRPEFAARARVIILGEDPLEKDAHGHKTNEETDGEDDLEEVPEELEGENNLKLPDIEFDSTTDEDEKFGASKGSKKEKDLEKTKRGVDFEKLKTTCLVAGTLLAWVLDVAKQVEEREGPEKMVPADAKHQKELLGRRLPRLPRMDRQYYHVLAKNSTIRGYQQQQHQYRTGSYGGYRDTSPTRYPDIYRRQRYQQDSYETAQNSTYRSPGSRYPEERAAHLDQTW